MQITTFFFENNIVMCELIQITFVLDLTLNKSVYTYASILPSPNTSLYYKQLVTFNVSQTTEEPVC